MIIYCPNCGQKCELDDEYDGAAVECPKCGKDFEAKKPAPPVTSESSSASRYTVINAPKYSKYSKPALCWILEIAGAILVIIGVVATFLCISAMELPANGEYRGMMLFGQLTVLASCVGILVIGCILGGFSLIVYHTGETAFNTRQLLECAREQLLLEQARNINRK